MPAMRSYTFNLFDDLEVSFRSEAELWQVKKACQYADSLYEQLKPQGSHLGRDKLLALLIVGIADDLLQLRQQHEQLEQRLHMLLQRIESESATERD